MSSRGFPNTNREKFIILDTEQASMVENEDFLILLASPEEPSVYCGVSFSNPISPLKSPFQHARELKNGLSSSINQRKFLDSTTFSYTFCRLIVPLTMIVLTNISYFTSIDISVLLFVFYLISIFSISVKSYAIGKRKVLPFIIISKDAENSSILFRDYHDRSIRSVPLSAIRFFHSTEPEHESSENSWCISCCGNGSKVTSRKGFIECVSISGNPHYVPAGSKPFSELLVNFMNEFHRQWQHENNVTPPTNPLGIEFDSYSYTPATIGNERFPFQSFHELSDSKAKIVSEIDGESLKIERVLRAPSNFYFYTLIIFIFCLFLRHLL